MRPIARPAARVYNWAQPPSQRWEKTRMAPETRERITDPERLSRLEGAHLHMATKADIAAVETRVMARIAESDEKRAESEIRLMAMIAAFESRVIKWVVGVAVTLFAAFASLAIAGGALLYRLLSS